MRSVAASTVALAVNGVDGEKTLNTCSIGYRDSDHAKEVTRNHHRPVELFVTAMRGCRSAAFGSSGLIRPVRREKLWLNAWKERTAECGGNIPTNVGLDGKPGGEYGGQRWKGTYG